MSGSFGLGASGSGPPVVWRTWKTCGHARTPRNTRAVSTRLPGGRCRQCLNASKARYNATDKGRAAQARYNASDKGQARRARYSASDKGWTYKLLYGNRARSRRQDAKDAALLAVVEEQIASIMAALQAPRPAADAKRGHRSSLGR